MLRRLKYNITGFELFLQQESVTSSVVDVLSLCVPSIIRVPERSSFTCARAAVAVRLTFEKNSRERCTRIMENP